MLNCYSLSERSEALRHRLAKIGIVLALVLTGFPAAAREKDTTQYGMGLIVNIPFPENEVTQVVQDVIQNGIIRGTKEYSKDEYVRGANPAASTRVFQQWTEAGKVFYKVRLKALDPLNFKDSTDMGTLAVRYVVQPQDDKHTVLRIDARFVEDFRHVAHASNGSVESAEYKDIHDRLDALQVMKKQTAEAEKSKQEYSAKPKVLLNDESSAAIQQMSAGTAPIQNPTTVSIKQPQDPPQNLEDRVRELRRQVERLVKAPGAPLKSAPFHSAATLQSLPTGTELLIEITTPYWLGVETHDGQHGWMLRDQLELLP